MFLRNARLPRNYKVLQRRKPYPALIDPVFNMRWKQKWLIPDISFNTWEFSSVRLATQGMT
jgi:hypothetical protein